MKKIIFSIILFILISLFTLPVTAQNILIWKNDNQTPFTSPDSNKSVLPDYGIRLALTDNYHSFTLVNTLPQDLSVFDIIFITLGFAYDCG